MEIRLFCPPQANLHGFEAKAFSHFDIGLRISRHDGARQVDVMFFAGLFEQACLGLSAIAPLIRGMGAVIDSVKDDFKRLQKLFQSLMDPFKLLDGKIPAPDARLVCDDDKQEASLGKGGQSFARTWREFDLIGVGEIGDVVYQRIISIYK